MLVSRCPGTGDEDFKPNPDSAVGSRCDLEHVTLLCPSCLIQNRLPGGVGHINVTMSETLFETAEPYDKHTKCYDCYHPSHKQCFLPRRGFSENGCQVVALPSPTWCQRRAHAHDQFLLGPARGNFPSDEAGQPGEGAQEKP